MDEMLLVIEVRRGMAECVYSDVAGLQVYVLDRDGEAQGYGKTELEAVEMCPVSALRKRNPQMRQPS
jgi:hypothetical protein